VDAEDFLADFVQDVGEDVQQSGDGIAAKRDAGVPGDLP
jgi:hypothetical protein